MTQPQTQTLYIDTEKSGADYIADYANLPGVQGELWHGHKIPVLGVCGEIGQGKTTFLLDIACGPISYVDLPAEMVKTHTNGWKPIDVYLKWLTIMRAVPVGRFRVIALDVSEEIEAGIADWVWQNPLYFNHTTGQYMKMNAIYQSDVSSLCKMIFAEIASKCETFAFANHMGLVFKGGEPTGEKKNKGRPVFKQLAAMYIRLTRDKDPTTGNVSAKPSGSVDLAEGGKARLRTRINGEWVPILPPRLPVATPDAIRGYIVKPPDYAALKPEERQPERVLTDDERTQLRIQAAQAEAETERLRIERLQTERQGWQQPQHTAQPSAAAGDTGSQVSVGDGHPPASPGVPAPAPQQSSAVTPTATPPQPEAPADAAANGQHTGGDEPTEKQRVRDAITAAVQRLNLPADKVQETIHGHILAVNEGVSASLGRLGVKKLAAILERLTGSPAPVTSDQPATLQETMATGSTPTPAASPPSDNGNGTHADTAPLAAGRIRAAWEELAFHLKVPADQKDKAFEPLLARYNASRIADLNAVQACEVEGVIVGKLRAHYAAHPELGPSPF